MDSVVLQWVGCPLLDSAGERVRLPSSSDDDDDPVDLLNRREGHCAATVCAVTVGGVSRSSAEALTPRDTWVMVCGGYCNGSLSAFPLVAPSRLLPALQWFRLPAVDVLECDGASLTVVGAPGCVEAASYSDLNSSPSSHACCHPVVGLTAYLFGGLDADMNRRNTLYAVSLHLEDALTPQKLTAEIIATAGTIPEARCRHGAGASEGRLYIFGGETDTRDQSCDLYVCDVATGLWRRITSPPGTSAPAPRLLSLSLLFLTRSMLVLYGGSHFVERDVRSFGDVWCFDVSTEMWVEIASRPSEDSGSSPSVCHTLPPSNGHAGGTILLAGVGIQGRAPSTCAVFLGGKNISEGDDAVKLIWYDPVVCRYVTCACDALPSEEGRTVPHWRYTPAVVTTEKGLLLLAGQCRHPQIPSSFLLSVR